MISVHTDGSASYKLANGGWALVAQLGDAVAELYGFKEGTTISEMELVPIRNALLWLPIGDKPLRILSDSQYAVKSINVYAEEWEFNGGFTATGKPPAHWELIQEIRSLLVSHREKRSVTLSWIPGHNNYPNNERADFLAGYARKNQVTNWQETDAVKRD